MSNDLYAQRIRIVSGSSEWTLGAFSGSDPNGLRSEPTGSLVRAGDGGLWINSNGDSEWLRFGAGSLTCSYTAAGTEGSQITVSLPSSFPDSNYRVFVTNVSGSSVSAYQVPEHLRTASSFKVNSSAPFAENDKLDFLCVSGTIYAGGSGGSSGASLPTGTTGTLLASTVVLNESVTYEVDVTGTIDWIAFGATSTSNVPPRAHTAGSTLHQKKTGPGWLITPGVDLVYGGFTLSAFTQAGSTTIKATIGNSTAQTGYSSTVGWGMHSPGATDRIGWGFKGGIFVPGDNVTRTLKVYGNQFNCITEFSCSMYNSNGTLAESAASADCTAASNTRQVVWTVSYSSPASTWLYWNLLVSHNYSTTSNLKIQAMTIE